MSDPITTYLRSIEKAYGAGNATEHTYRPAFQALVESFAPDVSAVNEPKRVACGAPDFIVSRDDETVGYIECKDLDARLDEIEKSDQLQRYLDGFDTLILTNYIEFRYYVHGEQEMHVCLARVTEKGRIRLLSGADSHLGQLVHAFLATRPAAIATPKELAERLANAAKIIRDAIFRAFDQEEQDGSLHGLFEAFRTTILADITREQFADTYAQTVCYGMFSARVNVPDADVDQFSRKSAAHDLPATNPFLREVFEYIAGTRLNPSVVWAVDLLASILRRCDMTEILRDFGKAKQREDPVVHFYESFLAAYDPALRESRGVYYTPEPVVGYIVQSIDAILKRDFDCAAGLADNAKIPVANLAQGEGPQETHRVQILDPATGTGTFLFETVKHIYDALAADRGAWAGPRGYVTEHLLPRLHGFELMMAPYAVAHMKLGWLLKDTGYVFPHDERLRVYLTNTLDEAEIAATPLLVFAGQIAREANAAGKVKSDAPIMVVLGNPPYSGHSANKNEWSRTLIKQALPRPDGAPGYFECDGKPLGERNPKWLNDDYVKFIRFGQSRIERTGYGVLAFVTNHGYLDNPTFRGMRQSLMHTFDEIYLLDLHGNTKKRETAPDGSKDENVFDIQQGVSIGIFVRKEKRPKRKKARVFHADIWGPRPAKYNALDGMDVTNTAWTRLKPESPSYLFTPQDTLLLGEYQAGWAIGAIMPVNSVGIVTARDKLTIQFTPDDVWRTVQNFVSLSPEDARDQYGLGKDAQDWKITWAQEDLKASGPKKNRISPILYRPFDQRYTYYTGKSSGFLCRTRDEVMRHMRAGENVGLFTCRQIVLSTWTHSLVTKFLTDDSCVSNRTRERGYLFPLYLYPNGDHLFESSPWPEGKDRRRPNLDPAFVEAFSDGLGMTFVTDGQGDLSESFGPEDILHYIYALFHSPAYRRRYAPFLKMDFPRVPMTHDRQQFIRLCALGRELIGLHLLERIPSPEAHYPKPGSNRVEKPRYAPPHDAGLGRVYINDEQYFEPVSSAVWEFQVGGYQVCAKWLKDRKGQTLDYAAIERYRAITESLRQTLRLMEAIDQAIPSWPIA